MKIFISIIIVSLFCFSHTTSFAQEQARNIEIYLGGKFMLGSADLAVGKYTELQKPTGPAKEGKTAGYATQLHWGGGAVFGITIPIIPLLSLRTEFEYLHGRAAKTFAQGGETKVGFTTNTMLFNTYVDFISLHPLVKPYIGIGFGLAANELKYTPASIDIGTSIANPVTFAFQTGIGTYIRLGIVALDFNIRYLYSDKIEKTYINSGKTATRTFRSEPHAVEGLISILVFI